MSAGEERDVTGDWSRWCFNKPLDIFNKTEPGIQIQTLMFYWAWPEYKHSAAETSSSF